MRVKFDVGAVRTLLSRTAKITVDPADRRTAPTPAGGSHAAPNPIVSSIRRLSTAAGFVRTRIVVALAVLAAVVLGLVGVAVATASPAATWQPAAGKVTPSGSPSVPAAPPAPKQPAAGAAVPGFAPPADPTKITAPGATLYGWALLHTDNSQVYGSANLATMTNTTESMIKPWIASDYLRRLTEQGQRPSSTVLAELTLMLDDSNDSMAEKYYRAGGTDSVTRRMITICGLTKVSLRNYYWAGTQMSPQDAAKYGECLLDGRAAGPQWTTWILDTMKHVRGGVKDQVSTTVQGGHWGIIDGVPANVAADMSIKNGWTPYGDGWHINCLAVTPHWILAVMMRIPSLQQGANACAAVAKALVVSAAP